jgi:uncharacterized protein YbjT (DUF2867 family)
MATAMARWAVACVLAPAHRGTGLTARWRLNAARRPAAAEISPVGLSGVGLVPRPEGGLADPVEDVQEIPRRASRVTITTPSSSSSAESRAMITWDQGASIIGGTANE